jgi:probable F420-dependent oxidoreductase
VSAVTVSLATSVGVAGVAPRDDVLLVQRAQDWGYTAAWAAEVDGPEAFSMLGALAMATDMDLGVAVVPVQTRTPFVLGMAAMTMAGLAPGRFALGVGASSEVLVTRFAGQPFDKPLTNVREVVEALQPVLAGDRGTYHGEYVDMGGYRFPKPVDTPVPLYLGSLNPKSLRLAGELGDGVCFNQMAPHHVPRMLEEVRAGAEAAGRDLPDDFPVVARLFCLVTDDVAGAREMVRHVFAPYIATTVYNRFYRWMGYEEEATAIADAAASGDKEAMVAAMSDRIVDDLFLLGDADTVAARVQEYVDAGVTVPAIAPMAMGVDMAADTFEALGRAWTS